MNTKFSVIQATMIKITILVFSILLILYFVIARLYWDNGLLQKKADLLALASMGENYIQNSYLDIKEIKQNKEATNNEKVEAIDLLLKESTKELHDNSTLISYYDIELDYSDYNSSFYSEKIANIQNNVSKEFSKESVVPVFISDANIFGRDEGIIGVILPVYKENIIMGHVLTIDQGTWFVKSYLQYSSLFIPSLILLIIVALLIRQSITQIKLSLDAFTNRIFKDKFDDQGDIDKLPELKPVFDTIKNYFDNLRQLNIKQEETNGKLLTIMQGISDGFFSLDRRWRFTFVNEQTKKLIGNENIDLVGKNAWKELKLINNLETIKNLTYAIREKTPRHWETKILIDGRFYEFHAYPFAQGVTVFFRDVTQLKEQEKELLKLERLNLIGQMAAGISHEVRNPLTTVRGFLQMLESKADSERNKEYMEIMISEIDRACEIITDFLSLAKANIDSSKKENINKIIINIFPMLEADAFNWNKEVILKLEEDIPQIQLNESEIKQLILNLVRNGIEATTGEGKVSISSYLENNSVVLAIKDEGDGIPQEVQEKLGTPFVTTKDTGTGLGLPISIGIANRHKAEFTYETGSGGTTFYVKFPINL